MSTGVWVGTAVEVERTPTRVVIQQQIDYGYTVAWGQWTIEKVDGEVELSTRGDDQVRIPAHVLPLVIAAMQNLVD